MEVFFPAHTVFVEDLSPDSEALVDRIRRAAAMGRAARKRLLDTLDEIERERVRHGAGG